MAGVLERVIGPRTQRRLVKRSEKAPRVDHKALELRMAVEILAEVFSIRTSEVEEMLLQRGEQKEQWPEEFLLVE